MHFCDLGFRFWVLFWVFEFLWNFFGWDLLICYHMPMHCISYHYNNVSCILRLCAWLTTVSAIVWIEFLPMMQFTFACHMFMHCHALYISFPSFLSILFCCVFFSFLLPLVSWLWHPKSQFLPRTRSLVVVLHLLLLFPLFLIELGSIMRTLKRISMRTSLTGWLIRNARSFYLIF